MAGMERTMLVVILAITHAAASCELSQQHPETCYHNPSNKMRTLQVTSANECCAACSGASNCGSWTFWGGSSCNLFRGDSKGLEKRGVCTSGGGAAVPPRPNILFVFPDTLRAESFSGYGNPLDVSPNLEAFAKTATRFEQAHVMHTQCSPSRATMMTGRYMHVLGHRTQIHLIQPYEENYWRLLKESGYHVAWFGKNDALSATAFNLSVSEWKSDIGYDSGANRYKYGEAGYWSMLSSGGNKHANDTKNGDYRAVADAIDFLNSNPPEPWALFLPTRGAHPPYGAPPEFQEKFPLTDVKDNIKLRPPNLPGKPRYHSYASGIPHYRNLTTLSEDTFYEIQRTYLAMVSYTDWCFGELMKGLAEAGVEEKTAVFFSSDHGDFGGDFHMVEKWPGGADDVLTRVPLYARVPGGVSGHVSKAPVQTADIMETMLELAQINTTWVRFGQSLMPQLKGGEGDMARTVYSEGGFGFHSELFPGGSDHVKDDPHGMYWPRAQEEMSDNGNGSPKWVMMRNLTAKLVYRPKGVSELYDLKSDPRELHNLYGDPTHTSMQSEMMLRLSSWLVQTGDVPPLRTDKRGPPKYPHPLDNSACSSLLQPDPSRAAPQPPVAEIEDYLRVNGVEGSGFHWLMARASD